MTARLKRIVALALVLSAVFSSCADSEVAVEEGTSSKDIAQLPADLVPAELLGLQSKQEEIGATLATTKRAYIDGVGLYSFRRDELLQATLQVSRFNDSEETRSAKFRRTVVSQIGGSVPKLVRVGDEPVYLTSGTKQTLAMWFRGRNLLILAVREDFGQPRTLLREALKVQL